VKGSYLRKILVKIWVDLIYASKTFMKIGLNRSSGRNNVDKLATVLHKIRALYNNAIVNKGRYGILLHKRTNQKQSRYKPPDAGTQRDVTRGTVSRKQSCILSLSLWRCSHAAALQYSARYRLCTRHCYRRIRTPAVQLNITEILRTLYLFRSKLIISYIQIDKINERTENFRIYSYVVIRIWHKIIIQKR
jgi:hypothetical protein